MSQLFVISHGDYDGDYIVGYAKSEEEANAYCTWANQYDQEWGHYWYKEIKPIDLAKKKVENKAVYEITIEKFEKLYDSKVKLVPSNQANRFTWDADEKYPFFTFEIATEDKSEAKCIAFEQIAVLKELQVKHQSLKIAVDLLGGISVEDY